MSLLRAVDILEPLLATGAAGFFALDTVESGLEYEEEGLLEVPSIGAVGVYGALLEYLPEDVYLHLA